jgi:hypothetical protein
VGFGPVTAPVTCSIPFAARHDGTDAAENGFFWCRWFESNTAAMRVDRSRSLLGLVMTIVITTNFNRRHGGVCAAEHGYFAYKPGVVGSNPTRDTDPGSSVGEH